MRLRHALALGLLAATLAACTGGGGGAGENDANASGPVGGPSPGAEASPLVAPGLEVAVELTGPATEGAGEVPTFTWTSVPSASLYRLVVLDAAGGPIWAWEGAATSVNLGGLPDERPVGEPGPVIDTGSSWSVAAFDADGHVVAVSASRPVSP